MCEGLVGMAGGWHRLVRYMTGNGLEARATRAIKPRRCDEAAHGCRELRAGMPIIPAGRAGGCRRAEQVAHARCVCVAPFQLLRKSVVDHPVAREELVPIKQAGDNHHLEVRLGTLRHVVSRRLVDYLQK